MKQIKVLASGLVASFFLVGVSNGATTPLKLTLTLTPSLRPVARSYPGVHADILGARTGMTVPEVEKVAKKTYPVMALNDHMTEYGLSWFFDGGSIKTKPVMTTIQFSRNSIGRGPNDIMDVTLTSPALGSRVEGIEREISWYYASQAPFISDVRAGLVKKYGPVSYQAVLYGRPLRLVDAWVFNKRSQVMCKSLDCIAQFQNEDQFSQLAPMPSLGAVNMHEDAKSFQKGLASGCGVPKNSKTNFRIIVISDISDIDLEKAKTNDIAMTMEDSQLCMDDYKQMRAQLTSFISRQNGRVKGLF